MGRRMPLQKIAPTAGDLGPRRAHSPKRHLIISISISISISIIYLLKSTEQEDAHMINTRTRAGQERHRKLALTFCP